MNKYIFSSGLNGELHFLNPLQTISLPSKFQLAVHKNQQMPMPGQLGMSKSEKNKLFTKLSRQKKCAILAIKTWNSELLFRPISQSINHKFGIQAVSIWVFAQENINPDKIITSLAWVCNVAVLSHCSRYVSNIIQLHRLPTRQYLTNYFPIIIHKLHNYVSEIHVCSP